MGSVFVSSWHVIETELGPNAKHLCDVEKDSRGFLTGVKYCVLILFGAWKQTYHLSVKNIAIPICSEANEFYDLENREMLDRITHTVNQKKKHVRSSVSKEMYGFWVDM